MFEPELPSRNTVQQTPGTSVRESTPRPGAGNVVAGGVRPQRQVGPARSLRIALLFHLAPRKRGSMEDHLLALAREARDRGHQVDVYCRKPWLDSVAAELAKMGVGLRELGEIEANANTGRRTLASYDVVQLNFLGLRDRASLIAYAAAPARVVFVDHWSGRQAKDGGVRRAARAALDRLTATRISRVAAVSQYVQTRDIGRLGMDANACRTLYNGVDVSRFQPLPQTGRREPGEPLRILAVAHLIPHKGIDVLIRAVSGIAGDDVRLDIVGDGSEAERLQALAKSSGAGDRIRFLGLRSDVPDLLQQAHLFVHPAVWDEAFGLTIAEAMSVGVPIIASRVGAIPELIDDGVEGLLVKPGDESALRSAISRIAADGSFALGLGQAARQRAMRSFSLERCVREHVELCEEAAEARGLL